MSEHWQTDGNRRPAERNHHWPMLGVALSSEAVGLSSSAVALCCRERAPPGEIGGVEQRRVVRSPVGRVERDGRREGSERAYGGGGRIVATCVGDDIRGRARGDAANRRRARISRGLTWRGASDCVRCERSTAAGISRRRGLPHRLDVGDDLTRRVGLGARGGGAIDSDWQRYRDATGCRRDNRQHHGLSR
jgi:hypothetical protein